MTPTIMNLHPDDALFFHDVKTAMFAVAKKYRLPLRSVTPMSMPAAGMADRLGDCNRGGDIRLVMRCTVDGAFCDAPLSPKEVWDTAAHELAHLKHMNHGAAFQEFAVELLTAIENQTTDHREKVLARLVKMQAARDGEAAIGNAEAADAFATAINRMLIENELAPSAIDYAKGVDRDPVIEVKVTLETYDLKSKKVRVAWQESLARVVAKAHLCTFLIRKGSNDIWFVGTKSHAVVAEYAFGTLAHAAEKMCFTAYCEYGRECARQAGMPKGEWIAGKPGFNESWMNAFINRITERFDAARQAVVAEAPEGTSVALMRLDGQLVKVRAYIDDKFMSRRRTSRSLSGLRSRNSEGARRGRAAADAMAIGRKGVEGGAKKLIGGAK